MNEALAFNAGASLWACAVLALAAIAVCYVVTRSIKLVCEQLAGATQQSSGVRLQACASRITVKFSAHTDARLPWKFKPTLSEVEAVPGEVIKADYVVRNLARQPSTGVATYNVVPFAAGKHFVKLQCFCFDTITAPAFTVVSLPLVFYIDPQFCVDEATRGVKEVSLMYTMHKPAR